MLGITKTTMLRSQAPLIASATTVIVGAGVYNLYSGSTRPAPNSINGERTKTFGKGPAFKSLRLHSIEKLNHDTSRFRFNLPDPEAVSGLSLTSAILTVTRPGWRPIIRPYTPTSDLDEPGFLDLTIKKYPGGQASSHIHSLMPGDSLFVLATIGAYPWKQNEYSNVTMIAGGAGITPMYQLIKGIFQNPAEKTKVTLLFGINTDDDALFREEFNQYEKEFPDRFKVIYTVTNPSPASAFRKGRISKELIAQTVPDTELKSGKVFICGPPAMESSLMGSRGSGGILGELGLRKDQIFNF